MKYLRLATHDFHGAGLASVSVVKNLRAKGVEAKLVVLYKKSSEDFVLGIHHMNQFFGRCHYLIDYLFRKIYRLLIVKDSKYLFLDMQNNAVSAKQILRLYGDIPDVISCAWTSNFVSDKTILELKKLTGAKVVYEMTDDSPFTGGCHYPWDCEGYMSDCYPCPALKNGCRKAQKTLLFKKENVSPDMIISGVTNDCMRAAKSIVFKSCVILPSVFLPENPYQFPREVGRRKWDIPDNQFVIFCGAKDLKEERKGFGYLVDALGLLKRRGVEIKDLTILVAARNLVPFPDGFDIRAVGLLGTRDLFQAYCCADLYVCTSVEDSGPLMINQAFKAHIPILSFRMGVALDLIRHKENGYIANLKDSEDLCDGIIYCYYHKEELRRRISQINAEIENDIKLHKNAGKYLGLSSFSKQH